MAFCGCSGSADCGVNSFKLSGRQVRKFIFGPCLVQNYCFLTFFFTFWTKKIYFFFRSDLANQKVRNSYCRTIESKCALKIGFKEFCADEYYDECAVGNFRCLLAKDWTKKCLSEFGESCTSASDCTVVKKIAANFPDEILEGSCESGTCKIPEFGKCYKGGAKCVLGAECLSRITKTECPSYNNYTENCLCFSKAGSK